MVVAVKLVAAVAILRRRLGGVCGCGSSGICGRITESETPRCYLLFRKNQRWCMRMRCVAVKVEGVTKVVMVAVKESGSSGSLEAKAAETEATPTVMEPTTGESVVVLVAHVVGGTVEVMVAVEATAVDVGNQRAGIDGLGGRQLPPAAGLATEFAAACSCAADAVCAVDAEEAVAAEEAVQGDWFGRFGESESGALEMKQGGSSNGSGGASKVPVEVAAAGRWRWRRHGRRG